MKNPLLDGQIAMVTGAGSGIGRATARLLASEGARVIVVDISEDGGKAVANEIDGEFCRLDVGDYGAWKNLIENVGEKWGRLDFLHLNAGIVTGESVIDRVSLESYRRVMAVNLDGVAFGLMTAIPLMRSTGGSVVATASVAGVRPFPHDPIYAMSKLAVAGLVWSAAPQLSPVGIRINGVCPGGVDTAILQPHTKERFARIGLTPMPPEILAGTVVLMLQSSATGKVVSVQAGEAPYTVPLADLPGPTAPGFDRESFLVAQETWGDPSAPLVDKD